MATTWATLVADADFMREGNADFLPVARYSDSALIALMQTKAKRIMKTDLIRACKLKENESDDMSNLDTLVDEYVNELQEGLAYQQLYQIYYEQGGESGSKTDNRMFAALAHYNNIKDMFSSFKTDDITSSKSINTYRS